MKQKYTVSDGRLMLHLQPDEDGWFLVTSPVDPALITQARSIPEAFEMARDAMAALVDSRRDRLRWEKVAAHVKAERPAPSRSAKTASF